ncbi:hypothetical protein [Streptomyces sp. NPDC020983]|uniref:hypothetical protein n=1 Tax=Streptomyces sp. NPDC020983 TaxID=3365106 RepID=UPI0037902015
MAAAATAMGLLTGCGAPTAGAAGISVDASGRPVGYVAVCGSHIDGLTLYSEKADGHLSTINTWVPVHPIEPGVTSWPLNGILPGWGADWPTTTLVPRVTYVLYGWTTDNSWTAVHIDFTVADLKSLSPGRVSFFGGTAKTADFGKKACH